MPHYSGAVKTVDHFQISPPPGSVPATTIPLTVFDVPWLLCHQVQRVFFYDHPISTLQFHKSVIPKLTSSLSAALRCFYPFAGRLISAPRPIKPYILYSDGDSVSFTVAESTSLDFNQAASDSPNDVELLHPLLPKLPPPESKPDGTTVSNLLALKVTLFPGSGFCIGFEFRHVAADGIAFNHFVKSWAEISKSGGAIDHIENENSAPCHDKELIKENRVLEDTFLDSFWSFKSPWDEESIRRGFAGKVRATFSISADRISRMKAFVTDKGNEFTKLKPSQPATAFAVTSAFIWSSLIKSAVSAGGEDSDEDKFDCYAFPVDCRGRVDPKLPGNYFGNCLSGIRVLVKRKDLIGDDGIVIAAREIGRRIKEIEIEGAVRSVEKYYAVSGWSEIMKQGIKVVTVAGSSKLRIYDTDFGWGRPRKSEPVHVDFSGSVYYSDARDVVSGGIEFGLALSRAEIDSFRVVFESELERFRD